MPEDDANSVEWLDIVQQKVRSLRFGVVQIIVHESKVTQIERTEKIRVVDSERNPRPSIPLSRLARPE